jgi:deoxyadenosine/deoxycytidine kinase
MSGEPLWLSVLLNTIGVVGVCGHIGAGKTTFVREMGTRFERLVSFILERAHDTIITDKHGKKETILSLFIRDPDHWTNQMQNTMTHACVWTQKSVKTHWRVKGKIGSVFMDRIAYEHNVFIDATREKLSSQCYSQCKSMAMDTSFVNVNHVVFLDVSTDTALRRMAERARESEDKYARSYFQNLSILYLKWFLRALAKREYPAIIIVPYDSFCKRLDGTESIIATLDFIHHAKKRIESLGETPRVKFVIGHSEEADDVSLWADKRDAFLEDCVYPERDERDVPLVFNLSDFRNEERMWHAVFYAAALNRVTIYLDVGVPTPLDADESSSSSDCHRVDDSPTELDDPDRLESHRPDDSHRAGEETDLSTRSDEEIALECPDDHSLSESSAERSESSSDDSHPTVESHRSESISDESHPTADRLPGSHRSDSCRPESHPIELESHRPDGGHPTGDHSPGSHRSDDSESVCSDMPVCFDEWIILAE